MILFSSDKFLKNRKKLIKKNPQLKEKINCVFDLLAEDPFLPSLKSHKLGGRMKDLWSCSVAADCRIIFCFEKDPENEEDMIILVNIGSHDEVYS
jgi:mRNA interferase YafQ